MSSSISEPPTCFAIAHRFDDADAFAAAARGWDLDFRQLGPGGFAADLVQVFSGPVILTRCALNRRVEQRGAAPLGYRTFAIPTADAVKVRWRGLDVAGNHLMLFPEGEGLDAVSEVGFQVVTVSVRMDVLDATAERLGLGSIEDLFTGKTVLSCSRPHRTRLRRAALRHVSAAAGNGEVLFRPSFRNTLENDLVEELVEAAFHSVEANVHSMARSRSKVLREALAVIWDRADEPVTVQEIQSETGASIRTLRYVFEEQYGMSPKRFLQVYRLTEVRKLLRGGGPNAKTISDAANAWGFWHMGQFARDYRQQFGELPSETLKRTG